MNDFGASGTSWLSLVVNRFLDGLGGDLRPALAQVCEGISLRQIGHDRRDGDPGAAEGEFPVTNARINHEVIAHELWLAVVFS